MASAAQATTKEIPEPDVQTHFLSGPIGQGPPSRRNHRKSAGAGTDLTSHGMSRGMPRCCCQSASPLGESPNRVPICAQDQCFPESAPGLVSVQRWLSVVTRRVRILTPGNDPHEVPFFPDLGSAVGRGWVGMVVPFDRGAGRACRGNTPPPTGPAAPPTRPSLPGQGGEDIRRLGRQLSPPGASAAWQPECAVGAAG